MSMNKFYYSFVAILFAVFSMSVMTSCSDDDEPSADEIKTNIVGMWHPTHLSGYDYDNTEDENIIKVDRDLNETDDFVRVRNYGDGTYRTYWYSKTYGDWRIDQSGKYEIAGNKIRMYTSTGELDNESKVVSLKGNFLVFEYNLDEGSQYKAQVTYKRID